MKKKLLLFVLPLFLLSSCGDIVLEPVNEEPKEYQAKTLDEAIIEAASNNLKIKGTMKLYRNNGYPYDLYDIEAVYYKSGVCTINGWPYYVENNKVYKLAPSVVFNFKFQKIEDDYRRFINPFKLAIKENNEVVDYEKGSLSHSVNTKYLSINDYNEMYSSEYNIALLMKWNIFSHYFNFKNIKNYNLYTNFTVYYEKADWIYNLSKFTFSFKNVLEGEGEFVLEYGNSLKDMSKDEIEDNFNVNTDYYKYLEEFTKDEQEYVIKKTTDYYGGPIKNEIYLVAKKKDLYYIENYDTKKYRVFYNDNGSAKEIYSINNEFHVPKEYLLDVHNKPIDFCYFANSQIYSVDNFNENCVNNEFRILRKDYFKKYSLLPIKYFQNEHSWITDTIIRNNIYESKKYMEYGNYDGNLIPNYIIKIYINNREYDIKIPFSINDLIFD